MQKNKLFLLVINLLGGAAVSIGMDHEAYRHAIDPLPAAAREALVRDLA